MSLGFKHVLLDVDGTLVDSNAAHAHAWAQTLAEAGYQVPLPKIRRLIGKGGDRLVEDLTGLARHSEETEALGQRRAKLFLSRWIREVRPLPGARTLVLRLRNEGHAFALATAAKPEELEPLLAIADLADLVTIKTTSGDVEESKPHPETIQVALKKLHARPETAVMVGDRPYDIQAACEAGVASIAFTSGGWRAEELVGALAVLSGPGELARIVDPLRGPLRHPSVGRRTPGSSDARSNASRSQRPSARRK